MTVITSGRDGPPPERSVRVQFPKREVERARVRLRWLGRIAPCLASRVALHYFMLIRHHPRPEREEAWLAQATRFEIAGANRLSGFRWGRGPKILLVHGWEGRGTQMGAFATALAASGREVIAFDAPGHGQSEGRSSLRQFAIAVRDVVAQEGPFDGFIGHSFGVAGACFAITDEGVAAAAVGRRLIFVAPPDDLHFYVGYFERLLGLSPRVARGFERRLDRLLRASWSEARFCTAAAAAEVPLLVVADQEDLETPIAGAEALVEAWPQARLLRTSGLGHRRILRDPAVIDRVVNFLSGDRP